MKCVVFKITQCQTLAVLWHNEHCAGISSYPHLPNNRCKQNDSGCTRIYGKIYRRHNNLASRICLAWVGKQYKEGKLCRGCCNGTNPKRYAGLWKPWHKQNKECLEIHYLQKGEAYIWSLDIHGCTFHTGTYHCSGQWPETRTQHISCHVVIWKWKTNAWHTVCHSK